jgi:hypothetical protein
MSKQLVLWLSDQIEELIDRNVGVDQRTALGALSITIAGLIAEMAETEQERDDHLAAVREQGLQRWREQNT